LGARDRRFESDHPDHRLTSDASRREEDLVAPLPARDIGDVRLADIVEAGGCPICRARSDAGARFIDAILWESVNDVAFRRELDETRGFCETHSRAILAADRGQSGGSLGASILFRAILMLRIRELDGAVSAKGRTRRGRLDRALAAPECAVCATGRVAESTAANRLGQLTTDPAWRDALASADICLTHLVRLVRDAPDTERWRDVERRQVDRLRDIERRLGGFIDHSGQDRRPLMTDEERRAVDEAADLLGRRA
jgi:Family of unknown function (DUF6062)